MQTLDLNHPERFYEIRSILKNKPTLRFLYNEIYQQYAHCIQRSPKNGIVLEIGSGGGFAKEIIPDLVTSDAIAYPNIDRVMNATRLDFPENSLSCICMFNVLHHISDTRAFFREAIRCLLPHGRIVMTEPYAGWLSSWIYRYLHHENFDMQVSQWEFESQGPLSDANNALPSIIFERDRDIFCRQFPELTIARFEPTIPLRYWLTGGLKTWSLLPRCAYRLSCWIDHILIRISPKLGSFVHIELTKT